VTADPLAVQLIEETWRTADLQPGYLGQTAKWSFRPVAKRRPGDDFLSWVDLFVSIRTHGIIDPLITYRDRVLWGMRRHEIAGILDIPSVRVLRMADDPGRWTIGDVRAFKWRLGL